MKPSFKLKKHISVILSMALLLSTFGMSGFAVSADSSNAELQSLKNYTLSVKTDKSEIAEGDNITVAVGVGGPEYYAGVDCELIFNSEIFEYVSSSTLDVKYDATASTLTYREAVSGGKKAVGNIFTATFKTKHISESKEVSFTAKGYVAVSQEAAISGTDVPEADPAVCTLTTLKLFNAENEPSVVTGTVFNAGLNPSFKAPVSPATDTEIIYEYIGEGGTAVTSTAIPEFTEPGEYPVKYTISAPGFQSKTVENTFYITNTDFNVMFYGNGGTDGPAKIGITCNNKIGELPKSERTGYTLEGWFTNPVTGTQITADTVLRGNLNAYAHWTANSYNVQYYKNGGEGEMDSQSFTYDKSGKLNTNTYTKEGFNFVGWALSPYAVYADYQNNAIVKNLTAINNDNIKLYAIWTDKALYTIKGKVEQESTPTNVSVPGALVQLKQGNTVIATTISDENGEYIITGIPNGAYNIVATGHAIGNEDRKEISMVEVEDKDMLDANFCVSKEKLITNLIIGENIPNIVVGKLIEEAESQLLPSDTGKEIELKIIIEAVEDFTDNDSVPEENDNKAAQKLLKEASKNTKFNFININIDKFADGASFSKITETNNVLEFVIPFDFNGKTNIEVSRIHNGEIEKFTQLDSKPEKYYTDKTFYADKENNQIRVYASKYSMYAISYSDEDSSKAGSSDVKKYSVVSENNENGTISTSAKAASAGDKVTVSVAPNENCVFEKLTVKDANGNEITTKKGENDNSYVFVMPKSKVVVSAVFNRVYINPFVDVSESDYYYDSVLWAFENNITKGTDSTHFSPTMGTTRAQMVTFLWRANGSPELTAAQCPFKDVSKDSYYYNAVVWGYENGYVKGTSKTQFSPDQNVTRAQSVTFLARAAGVKDEAEGNENVFTDVNMSDYFNNAVSWATLKGITKGTSETTFSPNTDCTRGQIVTFLYRFLINK